LPKGIKVIIKDDGSVQIDYSGFQGSECFREAERLYQALKKLGIEVNIKQITPKTAVEEGVQVNV
jgi:hypothetical protein